MSIAPLQPPQRVQRADWHSLSLDAPGSQRIMSGAVERVRPKMMTVRAIMAGLLPIMWSHGTGAEVMQRIAVPMIGGMASSTLLTLIVIPAIYAVAKTRWVSVRSRATVRDAPAGAR